MKAPRSVWDRTRRRVLERDGWTCQICKPGCTHKATDVDHIRPQSAGGSDHPSNLRAACAHCNRGRGGGGRRSPTDWSDQLGRKRPRKGRRRLAGQWITPGGLGRID